MNRPYLYVQAPLDFTKPSAPLPVVWVRVAREVAAIYDLPVSAVLGRSRLRTAALARHHGWFELRERYGLSWPEIARAVGVKCHGSVMQGAKSFARAAGIVGWRG